MRAVGGRKSQTKRAVNQSEQQKAGSRWSIRVEGWLNLTVCVQLVCKAAIFAFLADFRIARISLVKGWSSFTTKHSTRVCDSMFLRTCTAVVTSNWSVCSCLCFSNSPLVSLSLASSSLDLISSDSWTGGRGGGESEKVVKTVFLRPLERCKMWYGIRGVLQKNHEHYFFCINNLADMTYMVKWSKTCCSSLSSLIHSFQVSWTLVITCY